MRHKSSLLCQDGIKSYLHFSIISYGRSDESILSARTIYRKKLATISISARNVLRILSFIIINLLYILLLNRPDVNSEVDWTLKIISLYIKYYKISIYLSILSAPQPLSESDMRNFRKKYTISLNTPFHYNNTICSPNHTLTCRE